MLFEVDTIDRISFNHGRHHQHQRYVDSLLFFLITSLPAPIQVFACGLSVSVLPSRVCAGQSLGRFRSASRNPARILLP